MKQIIALTVFLASCSIIQIGAQPFAPLSTLPKRIESAMKELTPFSAYHEELAVFFDNGVEHATPHELYRFTLFLERIAAHKREKTFPLKEHLRYEKEIPLTELLEDKKRLEEEIKNLRITESNLEKSINEIKKKIQKYSHNGIYEYELISKDFGLKQTVKKIRDKKYILDEIETNISKVRKKEDEKNKIQKALNHARTVEELFKTNPPKLPETFNGDLTKRAQKALSLVFDNLLPPNNGAGKAAGIVGEKITYLEDFAPELCRQYSIEAQAQAQAQAQAEITQEPLMQEKPREPVVQESSIPDKPPASTRAKNSFYLVKQGVGIAALLTLFYKFYNAQHAQSGLSKKYREHEAMLLKNLTQSGVLSPRLKQKQMLKMLDKVVRHADLERSAPDLAESIKQYRASRKKYRAARNSSSLWGAGSLLALIGNGLYAYHAQKAPH